MQYCTCAALSWLFAGIPGTSNGRQSQEAKEEEGVLHADPRPEE